MAEELNISSLTEANETMPNQSVDQIGTEDLVENPITPINNTPGGSINIDWGQIQNDIDISLQQTGEPNQVLKTMIDFNASSIQPFAVEGGFSFGERPENSTANFNPYEDATKDFDLSTPEGQRKALATADARTNIRKPLDPQEALYQEPIPFGVKQTNLDRYYLHEAYDKLGFHPFADNESYYNRNSTGWDDWSRSWGQFKNMFGPALTSSYRSYSDIFGNKLSETDYEGGYAMREAMRIGGSQRGGSTQFWNDLALNSAYTFGIITNIMLEELALAAAIGVTGGYASVGAPAVQANQIRKLSKLGKAWRTTTGPARRLMNNMNNFKAIRAIGAMGRGATRMAGRAGQGGLNAFGFAFAPETLYAMKHFASTRGTTKALTNMSKLKYGAASLYRDFRALNLALSESKMEGSLVENDVYNDLYSYQKQMNGGDAPSHSELEEISSHALQAGARTTWNNFPIILASNRLLLDGALRGFKPLGRMMNETLDSYANRIFRNKNSVKQIFEGSKDNLLRRAYKMGFKGGARYLTGRSLLFLSGNIAEGLQEVSQEATSHWVHKYYTDLYKSNSHIAQLMNTGFSESAFEEGRKNLKKAAVKEGVNSMMTKEGFHVFMSGFMMGGLVRPYSYLTMELTPQLYQRFANKKEWKKREAKVHQMVDKYEESLNDLTSDPFVMLDPSRIRATAMQMHDQNQYMAQKAGDKFIFYDEKHMKLYTGLSNAITLNKYGDVKSWLQDLQKMDNDELKASFKEVDDSPEKMKERLGETIEYLDRLKLKIEKQQDKNPNPNNPKKFKKGTPEYEREVERYWAHEHAMQMKLFVEDMFENAIKRIDSTIKDITANEKPVSKATERDVLPLLTRSDLDQEINLLGVQAQQEADTPELIAAQKDKLQRLKLLTKIKDVLYNDKNQLKEEDGKLSGVFDKSKKHLLKKPIENYLKYLARYNDDFINYDNIDNFIETIIDNNWLRVRAEKFNSAARVLEDPGYLKSYQERIAGVLRNVWQESKNATPQLIRKFIDQNDKVTFIKLLADKDIYGEKSDILEFLESDTLMPTDIAWYDENGQIGEQTNNAKFEFLSNMLSGYMRKIKAQEEAKEERKVPEQKEVKEEKYSEDLKELQNFYQKDLETQEVIETNWKQYKSRNGKQNREEYIKDGRGGAILRARYRLKLMYDSLLSTQEIKPVNFDNWLLGEIKDKNVEIKDVIKNIESNGKNYQLAYNEITNKKIGEERKLSKNQNLFDTLTTNDPEKTVYIYKISGKIRQGDVTEDFEGYKVMIKVGAGNPINIYDDYRNVIKKGNTTLPLQKEYTDSNEAKNVAQALQRHINREVLLSTPMQKGQEKKGGVLELTKGEEIYDKKGRAYQVLSTPATIKDNKSLLAGLASDLQNESEWVWFKDLQDFKDQGFKKFNPKSVKINEPERKVSKLRISEPIQFYGFFPGHRDLKKQDPFYTESKFTNNDAYLKAQKKSRDLFDTWVRKLTPEGVSNLTINIYKPKLNEEDKTIGAAFGFTASEQNPYLRRGYTDTIVTLLSNNKPVARLQGLNSIKLLSNPDDTDSVIEAKDLTPELVDKMFILPDGKTYLDVIDNYKQAEKVNELFQDLDLKPGENITLAINDDKLKGFNLSVSPGQLTYRLEDVKKGVYNWQSLEFKWADKFEDENKYIIIEKKTYWDNDGDSSITIDYHHNYNSEQLDRFREVRGEIENSLRANAEKGFSVIERNGRVVPGKLGRYSLVVKTPMNKYIFIELKGGPKTANEVNDIFNKALERADKTLEENVVENQIKSKAYNTEWNDQFSDDFYIANVPGSLIDLQVTNDGQLLIKFKDRLRPEIGYKTILSRGDINTLKQKEGNFAENALALFNTRLDQANNLKRVASIKENKSWEDFGSHLGIENFRNHLPTVLNLDPEEGDSDLESLSVGASPEVIKNQKLVITFEESSQETIEKENIDSIIDNAVALDDDISKRAESISMDEGIEEEAEITSQDDAAEAFVEDPNFTTITDKQLKGIAIKIVDGIKLEPHETSIFNARKEDVNTLVLEVEGDRSFRVTDPEPLKRYEAIEQEYKTYLKEVADKVYSKWEKTFNKSKQDFTPDENIKANGSLIREKRNPVIANKIKEFKKRLDQAKMDINNPTDTSTPNFIGKNFTWNDIEDVKSFVDYMKRVLPQATVETVSWNTLQNNMIGSGYTAGLMQMSFEMLSKDVPGKILIAPESPQKRHEPFHIVFRALLPENEQTSYYNEAKKIINSKIRNKEGIQVIDAKGNYKTVNSVKEALESLKNSSPKYYKMTTEELKKELYEETLAQMYDKFSENRKDKYTKGVIRSFFEFLADLIKNIIDYIRGNKVDILFRDIDMGRYSTTRIANNPHTRHILENGVGTTIIAPNRIAYDSAKFEIPYFENGETKVKQMIQDKILGSHDTRILMSTIHGIYNEAVQNAEAPVDYDTLKNEAIAKGIENFNPDDNRYKRLPVEKFEKIEPELASIYNGLRDNGLVDIQKALNDMIEAEDERIARMDDELNDPINTEGSLTEAEGGKTTDEYGKSLDEYGGYVHQREEIRQYISSTTVPVKDRFGNEYLPTGERLRKSVDHIAVYNYILNALVGVQDDRSMLRNLYIQSRANPDIRAFVSRFFNDIGVNADELANEDFEVSNDMLSRPAWYYTIVKPLQTYSFEVRNALRSPSTGMVEFFDPTAVDKKIDQVNKWAEKYRQSVDVNYRLLRYNEAEAIFEDLQAMYNQKSFTQSALEKKTLDVSQRMYDTIGIKISPITLQYWISSGLAKKTPIQKILVLSQQAKDHQPVLKDTWKIIWDILQRNINGKYENLFNNEVILDENQKVIETNFDGAAGRLLEIAESNSYLDPEVALSSYVNANGDRVWRHQIGSYHLRQIAKQNSQTYIDNLKQFTINANNPLFAMEEYQHMTQSNRNRIVRMGGVSLGETHLSKENELISGDTVENYKFGSLPKAEIAGILFSKYLWNFNSKSGNLTLIPYQDKNNKPNTYAEVPYMLNVPESANTVDFQPAPVLKSVEINDDGDVAMTKKAKDFAEQLILDSYNSLRESFDSHFSNGMWQPDKAGDETGYNDTPNGNAFKIFDVKELLRKSIVAKEDISAKKAPILSTADKGRILSGSQKIILRDIKAYEKIGIKLGEKKIVQLDNKKFVISVVKKNIIQYGKEKFISDLGNQFVTKDKVEKKNTSWLKRKGDKTDTIYGYIPYAQRKQYGDFFFNEEINKYIYTFELAKDTEKEWVELPTGEFVSFDVVEEETLTEEVPAKSAEEILIEAAKNKKSFKEAKAQIKKELGRTLDLVIEESLESGYEDLYSYLLENNMLDRINARLKDNLTNHGKEQNNKGLDLAMSKLNLNDNPQYNYRQIVFSERLMGIALNRALEEQRQERLYGDPIKDPIKRGKSKVAGFENAGAEFTDKNATVDQGVNAPVKKVHMFAWNDEMYTKKYIVDQKLSKEGKIEEQSAERGDAGTWITPKTYEATWYAMGYRTPVVKKMMEKVRKGEDINLTEFLGTTTKKQGLKHLGAMINAKKYVYRGPDGIMIKTASFILSRQLTSKWDKKNKSWVAKPQMVRLHNLLEKLQAQEAKYPDTVAIAVPRSALKTIKPKLLDVKNVFNNTELSDNDFTELDANWLGLQVRNPGGKIEIVDPRQIKALIDSEQSDDVIVSIGGKPYKIGDIRKAYQKTTANRILAGYLGKKNLTFSQVVNEIEKSKHSDQLTPKLTAFIKYARISLAASQAKSHMLEMFDVDEQGDPKFNLNNPEAMGDFLKFTLNFFTKGVTAERQPGVAAALMPDEGRVIRVFDKNSIDKEGTAILGKAKIMRMDEWDKKFDEGTAPELKDMTNVSMLPNDYKVSPGEIVLDRLRANIEEYNEKGNKTGIKYMESMMAAHHSSAINIKPEDSLPSVFSKAFAIRIPTQDKHSAANIKIVDFLPPMYSSTIMTAYELIEISGSDFDIDKMYAQMADFYYDELGFHRYGDAVKEKDKYYDYMRYMFSNTKNKKHDMNYAIQTWKSNKMAQKEEEVKPVYTSGELEKMWFVWAATKQWSPRAEQYIKRFDLEDFNEERSKGEYANAKGFWYNREENAFEDYYEHVIIPDESYTREQILKYMEDDSMIQGSLEILNLPKNFKEYKEWKKNKKESIGQIDNTPEPYKAALDNKILDFKYALLGNKGMTETQEGRTVPIAYEPAVNTPFDIAWEKISNAFPSIKEIVKEEGLDINDILGKILSWDANHIAINSIGAIALSNISFNTLGKFNIPVHKNQSPLNFNNYKFKGSVFNNRYSVNPNTGKIDKTGYRTQYLVSALVSVIVDNAKDRLAHKHNLNKKALGLVGTLIAMGVDIDTSLLMVQQPSIRVAYRTGYTDKASFYDPGTTKLVAERIESLLNSNMPENASEKRKKALKKARTNEMENTSVLLSNLQEQIDLNLYELSDITEKENAEALIRRELAILNQWMIADEFAEAIRNLSTMLSLTAGTGTNQADINKFVEAAEYLGIEMNDKEMSKHMIPFDVRPIFKYKSKEGFSNMYQMYWDIFNDINDNVLPALHLAFTDTFKDIQNKINSQLYVYDKEEFIDKNSKDIVSYLMIKAYKNYLDTQQTNGAMVKASLNNGLIYDQIGGYKAIEAYDKITKYLNENNKKNTFIDGLFVKTRSNRSNKTGLDLLEFNSFAEVHDDYLQDMQRDLLLLFEDPHTMQDAQALVNYSIVKDGMQFSKGSFMQAILPILYRDIIDANTGVLETVHQLFKSTAQTDAAFENVFGKGMTKKALIEDLTVGFYKHINTQKYIKPLIGSKYNSQTERKEYFVSYENVVPSQLKDENIEVVKGKSDWDNILSSINTGEKLHVFEGVSTGEHRLEKVLGDKLTGDIIQIPVMFEKGRYWSDDSLNDNKDFFDTIINDIIRYGKDVVFYTSGPYVNSLKSVKEQSPKTYAYLRNKLIYAFGWDIETRKRETEKAGRQFLGEQEPIVYDAKNNYQNASEDEYKLAELEINILKNIKGNDSIGYVPKKDQYKKLKRLEIENQERINDNIEKILKAQSSNKPIFSNTDVIVPGSKGTQSVKLIGAPIVFKIDIPKKYTEAGEYRRKTFILAEIDTPLGINMNNIYDIDNEEIKNRRGNVYGTRFKYIEYKPLGSTSTFSTSHVLDGQLPAYEEIKRYIDSLKKDGTMNEFESLDDKANRLSMDEADDEATWDDANDSSENDLTTADPENVDESVQNLSMDEVGDEMDYDDDAEDIFYEEEDIVDDKMITDFFNEQLKNLSTENIENIKGNLGIKKVTLKELKEGFDRYIEIYNEMDLEDFMKEIKKKCK